MQPLQYNLIESLFGQLEKLNFSIEMGKKDSKKDIPLENFRKQIGKQDYKKSKSELKETKARAEAKKSAKHIYRPFNTIDTFFKVMLCWKFRFFYLLEM
ncbi:hypothetical protein NPIL_545861 [Nephila pilipes]|uniref:Triple QxxK/R motif-containing protein n=1 Tax=Nephila pilipes TaxID=299642 RepID=A0A8X6I9E2_NEPPI|nr:hypothetical protein NPIL_545861 [Nephila pilipes]